MPIIWKVLYLVADHERCEIETALKIVSEWLALTSDDFLAVHQTFFDFMSDKIRKSSFDFKTDFECFRS
jgi:hypothetical protein